MNFGVELGLFKDFRINFDYFTEHRDQILIRRQTIPSFQGVSASYIPRVNMGEVKNHGFEIEASYSHTFNKDFAFSVKGNFGFNDNKLIEYDEPMRSEDYAYQYQQEGFRMGQTFGYLIDWDSPGKGISHLRMRSMITILTTTLVENRELEISSIRMLMVMA